MRSAAIPFVILALLAAAWWVSARDLRSVSPTPIALAAGSEGRELADPVHAARGSTRLAPKAAAVTAPVTPAPWRLQPGVITGTVQDSRGAPLARVVVGAQGKRKFFTADTDARGEFEFTGLDLGSWEISVWPTPQSTHGACEPQEVEAGTRGLMLICPDRIQLVARFADGATVTKAWARRQSFPWCYRQLEAAADVFECATLDPGLYKVILHGEDGLACARDVALVAGEVTRLDLERLPSAQLRIVVSRSVKLVSIEHDGVHVDTILFPPDAPRERTVKVPAGRLVLRGGEHAADRTVYGPPIERWLREGEADEVSFEQYSWK